MKRKSLDSVEENGETKKVKGSEESLENGDASSPGNGGNVEGTEEYSLGSSEGFEILPDETLKNDTENSNNCENGDDVTILQRKETVEYTQDYVQNNLGNTNEELAIKPNLSKIESVQKDAELIKGIIPGIDMEKIYNHILRHRKIDNRVDVVTSEILDNNVNDNAAGNGTISDSSSSDDIFEEVAEVLVVRPKADPNVVFNLLEQLKDSENRVEKVLAQLKPTDDLPSESGSEISNLSAESNSQHENTDNVTKKDPFTDPAFKTNPLYKDLKTLRKVLPEQDPNEMYAFLEAHYDKPNRVQIVIDELTKSDSQESLSPQEVESFDDVDRGKAPMTAVDKLQVDLKELKDIFRDCDPNYLYEKLDRLTANKDRVQKVAADLFEHKNYPKLKDTIEKEKKEEFKNKITNMDFDMNTFLKKFQSPLEYFSDTSRPLNQNYKDHVLIYMKNTYTYLKDGYIKKVLEEHNHHLAPTVKVVEKNLPLITGRPSKKVRATPRLELLDYPEVPDEPFFQEVMFCQHNRDIRDFLNEQKQVRELKIEAAKKNGELLECGCCFDDECLFEEMAACADGHIFCKECIRRSSEAAIGEGKTNFPCLTGTCETEFPLPVLQELLPPTAFSLALRKMQEEELRLADIPDLVTCPFCSFATIMPEEDDKVFKCLNPECLKESCRFCKEPNHVPLRCNEVEKQGVTNMRTYIEVKVSESILRKCPTCKKRFYKLTGCNKMTCVCGTSMCYVCRTPNIDYDHFDGEGEDRCPIDSDITKLHDAEMEAAAITAKEEYLKDHPNENIELDTADLLHKLKEEWGGGSDMMSDGDDDEYDEY